MQNRIAQQTKPPCWALAAVWLFVIICNHWYDAAAILSFCLSALTSSVQDWLKADPTAAVLQFCLLVYLGTILYAAYMMHWVIQAFTAQTTVPIWRRLWGARSSRNLTGWMALSAVEFHAVIVPAALVHQWIAAFPQGYLKDSAFARKYIYSDLSLIAFSYLSSQRH